MTLTEFQQLINQAAEYAGETAAHVTVRIAIGEDECEIAEVRQMTVKPDVLIVAEVRR